MLFSFPWAQSSTLIHLPLLLPSCPPHLSHVGGKEGGGSHETFLWCCRSPAMQWPRYVREAAVAALQLQHALFCISLPSIFLFSLLCGAAAITTFRPCSLCFPIQRGVVPLWGWPHLCHLCHGHTRLLGHLSQVSVCSELSHIFWCCHIMVSRVPVKRCIKNPERFRPGKR